MELKNRYDVVVVGGGFAGVGAAIAAAREGKKVRLIEKYNALGGAAVYDLVNLTFLPSLAAAMAAPTPANPPPTTTTS